MARIAQKQVPVKLPPLKPKAHPPEMTVHLDAKGQVVAVTFNVTGTTATKVKRPLNVSRSIGAIAYGWGFNDSAHFSRAFRARFDLSPREWRARHSIGRSPNSLRARCPIGVRINKVPSASSLFRGARLH